MLYYRRRTSPDTDIPAVPAPLPAHLTDKERQKLQDEAADYVKGTRYIASLWNSIDYPVVPPRLQQQISDFNTRLIKERIEYENAINQIQLRFHKPERYSVHLSAEGFGCATVV